MSFVVFMCINCLLCVVSCLLLLGVYCLRVGVCCVLRIDCCCMLFVVCCWFALFVVGCVLSVGRWLSLVGRFPFFDICC